MTKNINQFDLFKKGKLLYASSIDISLPKGPSINEREFCWGLNQLLHNRITFLLPEPTNFIDEITNYKISFTRRCNIRNPYIFLLHQLDFSRKLSHAIDNQRYDIIITRLGLLPIGFYYGIKNYDIPIAIKHLTGYTSIPRISGSKLGRFISSSIVRIHDIILKKILDRAFAFDTPTNEHVKGIKTNFNINSDSIALIENATNIDRFKPLDKNFAREKCGLNHFDPIIGYAGGMPWERGGEEMISIAPLIIKQFPNVGFVIVGGGYGLDSLISKIRSAGLEEHFICTGIIPYEEVPKFINSFDVGIAFDRSERFSVVGNSNQKVRQYISCGKPVLVTPGGNEFVSSNKLGNIVHTTDIVGLATIIKKWLLLSKHEQEEHSTKAVKFAREYLSVERAVTQRIEHWNHRLSLKN